MRASAEDALDIWDGTIGARAWVLAASFVERRGGRKKEGSTQIGTRTLCKDEDGVVRVSRLPLNNPLPVRHASVPGSLTVLVPVDAFGNTIYTFTTHFLLGARLDDFGQAKQFFHPSRAGPGREFGGGS